MAKIIAVNAGSSSLKFQLLDMPSEAVIADGLVERIGFEDAIFSIKFNGEKNKEVTAIKDHAVAVTMLLEKLISMNIVKSLEEIEGVGHRVVHGGEKFTSSILITDEVIAGIEACKDLAPLHNPANLVGYKSFKEALPNVPAVAVFDTAFHQTMNRDAFLYPVPYEWYEKYGVRKYGFHGTSHLFVSQRAGEILGKKDAKVIVCHLGNGASLSAVNAGKCVDTSMGMTPLAGVMMGTRSGDIDPAIVDFICEKEGLTPTEVTNILNKKSGFLGVSGKSSDARDIEDGIAAGDEKCIVSFEIYYKRIIDHIAAYFVQLNGADAICFTAGLGENAVEAREDICNRLSSIGVEIDPVANKSRGKEVEISTPNSKVKVFVIPTNEELVIARDTFNLSK